MGSVASHAATSGTPTFPTSMWFVTTALSIITVSILLWRFSPFHVKVIIERIPPTVTAQATEKARIATSDEKRRKVMKKRGTHPFEFRERLWHEAPEPDFSEFECFDEVQKELKETGGKDLEFRTSWLDYQIDSRLFLQYSLWASYEHDKQFRNNGMDKDFYAGLIKSLRSEDRQITADFEAVLKRHGKPFEDTDELWDIMWLVGERHAATKKACP